MYRLIFVPTLTYGSDQNNMIAGRIGRNEFPLEGGWALPKMGARISFTWEELGVEQLVLHVEKSQMRWLGRLVRMSPW